MQDEVLFSLLLAAGVVGVFVLPALFRKYLSDSPSFRLFFIPFICCASFSAAAILNFQLRIFRTNFFLLCVWPHLRINSATKFNDKLNAAIMLCVHHSNLFSLLALTFFLQFYFVVCNLFIAFAFTYFVTLSEHFFLHSDRVRPPSSHPDTHLLVQWILPRSTVATAIEKNFIRRIIGIENIFKCISRLSVWLPV